MVQRAEARGTRGLVDCGRNRTFDRGCRGQILDAPAVRTHKMMMMLGELLGEFVSREFVARHHSVHDARFFEHDQVAVNRTLREPGARRENFRNRERAVRRRKHVENDLACGRESLTLRA